MLRRVTLLALLAAFLPTAASAATVDEVSLLVSGRAADVACLEQEPWEALMRDNRQAPSTAGLTWVNAGRARYAPWVCRALADGPGNGRLGGALNIVAHEAAHLRGIRDESVAACWGLLWVADLARRFYGLEFYSPGSESAIRASVEIHRLLPSTYHGVCP